ncbi:MAG: hypothetical protein ABIA93_07485 [Candidatus Woesearchaeota archaeon]
MISSDAVKVLVLRRLVRSRTWGGKHTPIDFVSHGLPDRFLNSHNGKKVLDNAIRELVNSEWLLVMKKRTGSDYNLHVSLNPRKNAEILCYLEFKSKE